MRPERNSPTAMTQDTPPGLEAVPISCYSGSFMTWAFDNDLMAVFEGKIGESGVDDELDDEKCNVEGTPMTEHFNIDISPDRNTSMHSSFDGRTFTEIGIQTETTLSINSADITWTPTCTSVISSGTSTRPEYPFWSARSSLRSAMSCPVLVRHST